MSGELAVRWLALTLQIAIPGTIGFYLAFAMGWGLSEVPERAEGLPLIVGGGAVIGFLAWLLGLIVDRVSVIRLVLTVALSMLGLTVSYLLLGAMLRTRALPALLVYTAFAAPLVGAIVGYYWLWSKLHVEGQ